MRHRAFVSEQQQGLTVTSRRQDDRDQGISDQNLDDCDVLIWWGHVRQRDVKPEAGQRIVERIKPDEVVFEERWDNGERFRSGSVWRLGKGRVVYFRPGHETFDVYKQPETLQIVENTSRWLGTELRTDRSDK